MLKGKSHRELIDLSRSLIQPLLPHYYKGQAGKVTVFGGCEDYTGAPYFASSASALVGSDLTHVVCEQNAAGVIKSYSPNLMVHPYLYDLSNQEVRRYFPAEIYRQLQSHKLDQVVLSHYKEMDGFIEEKVLPKVMPLISRCDVFVIGPGFGRDLLMVKTLVKIIEQIKVANKPVILDADALYVVSLDPSIIENYHKAVLTPNLIEFDRIAGHYGLDSILKLSDSEQVIQTVVKLSLLMGVTIVRKSATEVIVDGDTVLLNSITGSPRRVGGQGDTLTGSMATFLNWAYHYSSGFWETPDPKLSLEEAKVLAIYASSAVVRLASQKAYKRHGRAMQTSDIQAMLGEAYSELYDSDDYIKL